LKKEVRKELQEKSKVKFTRSVKSLEEGLLTNLASMGKLHAFVHDVNFTRISGIGDMVNH
jgi:hypothetical protein